MLAPMQKSSTTFDYEKTYDAFILAAILAVLAFVFLAGRLYEKCFGTRSGQRETAAATRPATADTIVQGPVTYRRGLNVGRFRALPDADWGCLTVAHRG